MKHVLTIGLAALSLCGCGNMVKTGTMLGLAGGGAAAGYALSGGKPEVAALAGLGGAVAGLGVNAYHDNVAQNKYEEGYTQGQADAAKTQYWMLQRQHEANAGDAIGNTRYYTVPIPSQYDSDGVLKHERTVTIPIVE